MTGRKEIDIPQNCFYVEEYPSENIFHGGIGNMDAEKIFLELGFRALVFPHRQNFSFRAKCERLVFLIKTLSSLPSGSIIIYQFPLYATLDRWLIHALSRRKKFTLICFITDIDGLKD